MQNKKIENFLSFTLLFLVTLLFFGSSIRYGFTQDDWFFLSISKAQSIIDFLQFFSPGHQQGFPFFRPLGTQVYFFLGTRFGLEIAPYLMHSFMLGLHATTSFIIYLYSRTKNINKINSLLIALTYLASGVHFLSLYYIAATQQLLATFLMILTLYLRQDKKTIRWSYATFGLALLSKENALLFPLYLLLFSDVWPVSLSKIKQVVINLLPYGVISSMYLLLRLTSGVVIQSEYHPEFGIRVFTALKVYFSFILGYYEKIQDYAFPELLPQYLLDTFPYGYLTLVGSILLISALVIGFTEVIIKKRKFVYTSYLLSFFVGLSPWLLLPDHVFPHYLDFPLFCLSFFLVNNFSSKFKYLLVLFFLISGYGAVRSSEVLHWAIIRSNLNAKMISNLQNLGICEANTVRLVGNDSLVEELSHSLSLSNGPRVFCGNDSLEVYYNKDTDNQKVGKTINLKGY